MSTRKAQKEDTPNITPPANLEAEQAVLGSIIVRSQVMDEVADLLNAGDFYREAHSRIYRVMLELYLRNEPIDLVTVATLLKERGQLEEVGGAVFLAGLSEHVGITSNAAYYAKVVQEKAIIRRVLASAQEIAGVCLAPVEDVGQFLDWAELQIYQNKNDEGQIVYGLDELVPEEQARIEKIYYRKKELLGIPSGFVDLDEITSGWQPSDLIIIAARPSMGKTALGINISYHSANAAKVPVGFFSMEMSRSQLVQRLMTSVGRINATRLRSAKMAGQEWATFNEVSVELAGVPIHIIDKPALTLMQIRSQARRLKSRLGVGIIVVDYLQLARHPGARSQEQETAEISRGLKALAKDLNLPVIALCQLNRDLEKRPNKRPRLPDLRGSGSIEQDADVVLFIYRDEVYRADSKDKGKAEISVAKQRNGPTGMIKLAYLAEYLRFENLAHEPAEAVF